MQPLRNNNCRITGKELLNELEDDNWWHSLPPHHGSRAAASTLAQALHQVNDGLHSIVKVLSPELAPLFAAEREGERQAFHAVCCLLHPTATIPLAGQEGWLALTRGQSIPSPSSARGSSSNARTTRLRCMILHCMPAACSDQRRWLSAERALSTAACLLEWLAILLQLKELCRELRVRWRLWRGM